MALVKIGNTLAMNIIIVAMFYGLAQCIRVEAYGSLQHPVQYIEKYRPPKEDEQDLHKIPGIPGQDYPIYHEAPSTGFHCGNVPSVPGMYANVETGCQAYHVCHDGREGHQGAVFLCSNGTIFNQKEFTCDWWYNVDCSQAPAFYHLNSDPDHNPYFPKKKTLPLHGDGNLFNQP